MSFFEKLRKNIEEETEESPANKTEDKTKNIEKPKEKPKKSRKSVSAKTSSSAKATEDKTEDKEEEEELLLNEPEKKLFKSPAKPKTNGELSIDFYETDDYFVVQSTISGIKANDLEIFIENDVLTIKGSRQEQREDENQNYFYRECYWGGFSRQIILPEEVDETKIQAKMKDGVLTLKIPKLRKKNAVKRITINEEE
jgi:HSP20 family molecular chaperone IbpA